MRHRCDPNAVVGAVVDEPVGRIHAAEIAAARQADAHRRPVVVRRHVHHRHAAGDRTVVAAPVGMIDLDLTAVDHPADDGDVAQAHARVGGERQHRARLRPVAARIQAGGIAPPVSGIAGKRHVAVGTGKGHALQRRSVIAVGKVIRGKMVAAAAMQGMACRVAAREHRAAGMHCIVILACRMAESRSAAACRVTRMGFPRNGILGGGMFGGGVFGGVLAAGWRGYRHLCGEEQGSHQTRTQQYGFAAIAPSPHAHDPNVFVNPVVAAPALWAGPDAIVGNNWVARLTTLGPLFLSSVADFPDHPLWISRQTGIIVLNGGIRGAIANRSSGRPMETRRESPPFAGTNPWRVTCRR